MADEEKEKAEKVAAARKRYEQLKKQKAKKDQAAKKGKEDKEEKSETVEPPTASDDAKPSASAPVEAPIDTTIKDGDEPDLSSMPNLPPTQDEITTEAEHEADEDDVDTANPTSEPSLSEQSRIRSESFKRGVSQTAIQSPPLKISPLSPGGGDSVTEIYKKQAARIEQLEKDNKRLEKDTEEKQKTLSRVEEEVEDLREAQADVADLKLKARKFGELEDEVEKLKTEISSLQRQNAQLSSQAKENRRRTSSNVVPTTQSSEELHAQIAAKANTIETLELELSNVRHENTTLTTRITTVESSLQTAQEELTTLRVASSSTTTGGTDASSPASPSAADETRMQLLTRDLAAAQAAVTDATARATMLEKKIDALTTLHRESEARNQAAAATRAKELERARADAADMRAKVVSMSSENARLRASSASSASGAPALPGTDHDDADAAEGESDADPGRRRLQTRVRELEAEIHELRRGVWRERRKELQGEADEDALLDDPGVRSPHSVYDDVDLGASTASTPPAVQRMRSSPYGAFANVLSAFTGATSPGAVPGSGVAAGKPGAAGLASGFFGAVDRAVTNIAGAAAGGGGEAAGPFLGGAAGGHEEGGVEHEEDDFAFDEDAFRQAQEEEGRRRLERVREIKRGLKEWEGWRVEMVDLRGGSEAGVFDV